jgi:uncharacterized membrane protein
MVSKPSTHNDMLRTPQDDVLPDARPVNHIDFSDLRWALERGVEDFRQLRGDLVFVGLIYPFVGLAAAMVALNQSLLPLLFPILAGISLLGPLVAAGFYELARRFERGDDIRWRHFFDVFTGPSAIALAGLGVILAGLFILWIASALAIYGFFFGDANLGVSAPESVGAFLTALFTTSAGWQMMIVGNLVGLIFAIVALAVSVVSFPMVVDKPELGATPAIETSMRAVARNPGTMIGWGLIVATLLVIGSIPLFVGLAVVLPVLGYATWHLYTRVVQR